MPMPAGALNLMRSAPQTSDTYLVVQQPTQRTPGLYPVWYGYEWSCQINEVLAGDPTVTLTVNNADAGPITLLDGMTVVIGSEVGAWDKAVLRLRGDQIVGAATVTLDIATSSDLVGNVEDDDYVAVWDEFRLWQRYGRIDNAAGVITWHKDYDILWTDIGANDVARRLAMMPPVPIMGSHAVEFMEVGGSVSVDFDWSDSYAPAVGAAVATWVSEGETDHVGGVWNDNIENPAPKIYTNVSGLAGFRVTLEIDDGNGNDDTLSFRRGIRYVFTLRRPGETQVGDPWNAEPIISFSFTDVSGSFQQGCWKTTITLYEDAASDTIVQPGALIILFTEDTYQGYDAYTLDHGPISESVGPIPDRENILFVGRVADDSIKYDPETQTVTFDAISESEMAGKQQNYPIVINDNTLSEQWIDTPELTVDRAIRYYIAWHTTLSLIADVYQTGDTHRIKAQDFLQGDIKSTLNEFLQGRLFARLLCDRFGRFFCSIDVQMLAPGGSTTLWVLDAGDWLDTMDIQQNNIAECNYVELGGLTYGDEGVTPYKSGAPGSFDKYHGRPDTSMALAITDQDELNILSGRLLAYNNVEFSSVKMALAGNWRVCDPALQESIDLNGLVTERGTLSGRYIIRETLYRYDAHGAIFTFVLLEQETDGPPGQTIVIPEELPEIRRPPLPNGPGPGPGPNPEDLGRRMISTNVGVFVTDDIGPANPYWYAINDGLITAHDLSCYGMARAPFHWWTPGVTSKRLCVGTQSGVWHMDGFPFGTWVQDVTWADLDALFAVDTWSPGDYIDFTYLDMSIEVDGLWAFTYRISRWGHGGSWNENRYVIFQGGAILNGFVPPIAGASGNGKSFIKFAQHSAGNVLYATQPECVGNPGSSWLRLHRTTNRGVNWGQLQQSQWGNIGRYTSISIPYVDASNPDRHVLWGAGGGVAGQPGRYWASDDQFVTHYIVPSSNNYYTKIGTGNNPDYIWLLNSEPDIRACKWSNDGGTTWTGLPLIPGAPGTYGVFASFVVWSGNVLQSALIGGSSGGVAYMYYWSQGQGAWQDKTGNLRGFGVTEIRDIDRDSEGSA